VELETGEEALVIDPLLDPLATFAALGDRAKEVQRPALAEPESRGSAVAGLVTHLHRDHTDAGALRATLAPDAEVFEPAWPAGTAVDNAALAQASHELDQAGLRRRTVAVWEPAEVGPFNVTALPAVDGLGDPQVSWLVEADGARVLHLGDTIFHGYWWRMARRHGPFDVLLAPINGAAVDFPHLQPPSPLAGAMEPEQAALAGELLRARTVIPIHYGGFAIEPWYRPVGDALTRFEAAAAGRPYETAVLSPGAALEPASKSADPTGPAGAHR